MRTLEFPAEVAIGGVEARADDLVRDSGRVVNEAERLIRALLRGERLSLKSRYTPPGRIRTN